MTSSQNIPTRIRTQAISVRAMQIISMGSKMVMEGLGKGMVGGLTGIRMLKDRLRGNFRMGLGVGLLWSIEPSFN
jgi:hypothetical protein